MAADTEEFKRITDSGNFIEKIKVKVYNLKREEYKTDIEAIEPAGWEEKK